MRAARHWFWLLLLVPAAIGIGRLRFDVELLNLLPPESRVVEGLKLYQQNFSSGDELLITVETADPALTEAIARSIASALRSATHLVRQVIWQPPWQEQPSLGAELIGYLWLNQPPAVFSELARRLEKPALTEHLEEVREQLALSLSPEEIARAGYDPLGLMQVPAGDRALRTARDDAFFVSDDGRFRVLFVHPRTRLASYRDCQVWLERVRERVGEAVGDEDTAAQVRYTGRPAFVAEISSQMEDDLRQSVLGTAFIVALLFWLAHRQMRPLLWLLLLLAVILATTLAIGGMVVGALNVISLGFAAILLGLAVDYGLVLFQEFRARPDLTTTTLRRQVGPSVLWSAGTTAAAFALLGFSSLPGMGQLGTLVAIGTITAAAVMLIAYPGPLAGQTSREEPQAARRENPRSQGGLAIAAVLVAACLISLWMRPPRFDDSPDALRPRKSESYATLDAIQQRFVDEDPVWLIVHGATEADVAERLRAAQALLENSRGVEHLVLPLSLWPNPARQSVNVATALSLLKEQGPIEAAILETGFSEAALGLVRAVFETWREAASTSGVFWPENDLSRWTLSRVAARSEGKFLAAGIVYPSATDAESLLSLKQRVDEAFPDGTVLVSGWRLLGYSVFDLVAAELPRIVIPVGTLLLVCLSLAFRDWRDVALSLATLLLGALLLATAMSFAGWKWNLMNMIAIPLLLGAGVDYAIHMQLALRRHKGNLLETRRTVGRALLLCAGTTIAGFGTLGFSNNAGLASLGQVCATGIACLVTVAVFLLPSWWCRAHGSGSGNMVNSPPSAYRASLWQLGLGAARLLPQPVLHLLANLAGSAAFYICKSRRETVLDNVRPLLVNDDARTRLVAKQLFRNFAHKLVDLWRYESGGRVEELFIESAGWEHFEAAQQQRRGVLLLTPHVGNWEFGAPLLARKGINLLVITLEEPDPRLTELRRASRARWGIETVVIGSDPFAFVEVIRRLESGATVALLVDRPAVSNAIEVEFCGRPFLASVAPAELARATGCVLLPVWIPRTARGYRAQAMPPIDYDRAALRGLEARRALTQKIMRAFEPVVQQNLEQWYHFVPIWPLDRER